MADPTPYIVSYSFGGFQASSPSTPLPATALDNELANAAAAIAALRSAVMDIRRSDGVLKNGIVTFDSFESGLQLLLDPTNGELVAAAVATAQAAAASAAGFNTSAGVHDTSAAASAAAAAASAGTVNLSLYLAKANNLAGLGSLVTSRSNLGLGSAAILDVGTGASKIVQLDGSAKLPAVDGSQLTNIDTMPVGAVIWVPATTAPTGFLKLNGALLSRATYARLWSFVNLSNNTILEADWATYPGRFSTGDLTTTFRLIDARGEFIRGWDDARGIDAGRVIGQNQVDSLKDHTHTYVQRTGSNVGGGGAFGPVDTATPTQTGSPSTGAAAETRPRNIAMLACIKY